MLKLVPTCTGAALTFTHWAPYWNDPTTHRFEDCVEMKHGSGLWKDVDCDYTYNAYVCEYGR